MTRMGEGKKGNRQRIHDWGSYPCEGGPQKSLAFAREEAGQLMMLAYNLFLPFRMDFAFQCPVL